MPKVAIAIPCYNEAQRLDARAFARLTTQGDLHLVFVDDGSSDGTGAWLHAFCAQHPGRTECVTLPRNRGKAEAVRQGLRRGLAVGAEIVGYLDADLATPGAELERLVTLVASGEAEVALGSRIRFLGARIERSPLRHYPGRVFATLASLILGLPVYDTQCGAKVFRRSEALGRALEDPFLTRWCFDVELLGRLLIGCDGAAPTPSERLRELPLGVWRDVPGSKLGLRHAPRIALELFRVQLDLARRRRAVGRSGSRPPSR